MKVAAIFCLIVSLLVTLTVAEEIPEVSIGEMESIIASKEAIILDVNGSKYFAKGHLPGAIDFRASEENLPAVLGDNKERLIVVYCGSPSCEAYLAAAAASEAIGIHEREHLPAGISGWITAGKPTDVSKD